MARLQITPEPFNQGIVLHTDGYINDTGGAELRKACETALAENRKNIIIDFRATELINSVGISNLITVLERVQEVNGQLIFTNLNPTVREVFDMMGLTKYAKIYQSAEEARNEIAHPDGQRPGAEPQAPQSGLQGIQGNP